MNPTAVSAPRELGPRDGEIVRLCATNLLEIVPELAVAMARHIHDELPEMGGVEDEEALDATRRSCEGNLREIFVMLRAGLPATAHQTPTEALEYVRFLRSRGVGMETVLRCYHLGVSMFHPVMRSELERSAEDTKALTRMVEVVREFVWVYVGRVTERLGVEYGDGREHRAPAVGDSVWANPASHEAARAFLEQASAAPAGATEPHARARAQAVLERFRTALETAARDERLTRRLTQADTTVRIALADEPDLALTALLQGDAIEVAPGGRPAEVELSLSSVDLERMWSGDFNLAMAIARGRVAVHGPARKFLRVMPIIRQLARGDADTDGDGPDPTTPVDTRAAASEDGEESRFDAPTRALLDRASEFRFDQGAPDYAEQERGYFWSIECRGVYKTLGRNPVLNELEVGIPEGMITVVLGPSGTCKSVLIQHLLGLMLPDRGEVLVHGRSVAELRQFELLELRRRFGTLFPDDALSRSLSVFDNVAGPLREHTGLGEPQIAEIVEQRLAEVGLGGAGDRMPSELSGDRLKRVGLARALVLEPEIVIFDEPASGLDAVRTALLCELIQQMHAEHGGTYIVITHDIESARRIADYLVVLWKGRIVQSGDRDDMFTSPNPFVRQFLAGRPHRPLEMG